MKPPRESLRLLLVACLLAGCATPPAPPPRPVLPWVAVRQPQAPPLALLPAAAPPPDAEPPPARFAHVELVHFPRRLSRALPRLRNHLRVVLGEDGRRALRPATLWWSEAQVQVPEALWTRHPATALWLGLVAWRGPERVEWQLQAPVGPRLALGLAPTEGEDRWLLSLRVRGLAPDPGLALTDDMDGPGAARVTVLEKVRAEDLLFAPLPVSASAPLRVLLPSPWDDGWLGLEVRPAQPDERAAAAALAAAERRRVETAGPRPPPALTDAGGLEFRPLTPLEPPSAPDVAGVLRAGLEYPDSRRATLHHAARATGLDVLAEAALVAPDVLVDAVARRLRERLAAGSAPELRTLLDALLAGLADTALPLAAAAPVDAVLTRHLGALDRRRDLLADALPSLPDAAAVRAFVRRENLLLLEDPKPATRVRAYEWLRQHDRAPAGFDPLGPRAERRAALENAAAEGAS